MAIFTLTKADNRLRATPAGGGGGGGQGTVSRRSPGAPSIAGSTSSSQSISPKKGTGSADVNVVQNYDWNSSPSSNIIKPPSIQLKEYYVDKSSFLAQLGYGISAFSESGFTQLDKLVTVFGSDKTILDDIKGVSRSAINKIKKFISLPALDSAGVSSPYDGLYSLTPTGFKYTLPFYEDTFRSKTASWQDQYSGQAGNTNIMQLVEKGNDLVRANVGSIPGLGAFSDPGLYIERTKHYEPIPGGEGLSFTFPLLNTVNPESIQKNYELIWLLAFQNSPYRKTISKIDPPCMYEVLIPGVRYIKYAVMTSLKIDFLGTRRRISITVPRGPGPPSSKSDVIVPEAYRISIGMKSLTDESANFMIESIQRGNSL